MNRMNELYEKSGSLYDELKWLYMELYDDRESFGRYVGMLCDSYRQRSAELIRLDQTRAASGDWYKDSGMLGMILYADAFADDLKGVSGKIGYIEECGVNVLHLMPLLESPEGKSDGGYAVSDFRKVRDGLGTMGDLRQLTAQCHSRGISICTDLVINHTSDEHEWAKRARRGEKEYQDMYFFYDDWDIPAQFERTVPQVFPTTAPGNFSWCEEAGKVVMTSFYPYQWDLNYANPAVLREMTANLLYLCNQGIDIIRLDAIPYVWKQLGTDCRNLPQVHSISRIFRIAVELVCPGVLLLGEVVMEPKKVVPYFGSLDKPECHMLYNVTTMCTMWNTVATGDVRLLRHQMDSVFSLNKEGCFLNYLRCHDDIGWGLDYGFLSRFGQAEIPHKRFLNDYLTGNWPGSDARGELYNDAESLGDARLCGTTGSLVGIEAAEQDGDPVRLEKALRFDIMLHAFLLTQPGLPMIYGGDETGRLNDYSYHEDPLKESDSRYLHRGRMNWQEAEERFREGSRQQIIFSRLRALEEIRKEYEVFSGDSDLWTIETQNDHILGIGRFNRGEKLLAFFNFSNQDETALPQDAEDYTDLITGRRQSAEEVSVEARGFRWLYRTYAE